MSCKIFCQFLFTNQLNFLYQNMLKICVSIKPASFFPPILIHTLIIYIIMDDILKSTTLEDEIQQNGLKKKIIIYYSF